MHLLLIAYDFPPVPSPQSLRWAYLVRELSLAGHTVEVIAPDIPDNGPGGLPSLPKEVAVHRVDPGRFSRLLRGRARRDTSSVDAPVNTTGLIRAPAGISSLNWKGRLRRRLEASLGLGGGLNWKGVLAEKAKSIVSNQVFPDYRVEWVGPAIEVLEAVVAKRRPDAVIASHEPACSLPVGLAAAKRGLLLVVDMGDPVLAPYTPEKWRMQAGALERSVCDAAVMISVTTESAARTLKLRHMIPEDKVHVMPQGFDPGFIMLPQDQMLDFDESILELLYTGSFYSFRRAEEVLSAVRSVPGVRLTVATVSAPDYLIMAAESAPQSIRLVGFMPHRGALAAQRCCDVLVNLANADPVQVPGKVFEYLGAGKPILHLRGELRDATGEMLMSMGAGWDMVSEQASIKQALQEMKDLKRAGKLGQRAVDADNAVAYAWPQLARSWSAHLCTIIGQRIAEVAP
ncbi:glycosyltransferase [Stenotrophomonas sp. UBA7606]|uniref:glycosyltransferase n=1 Tax=Stenotrophomonas sp. UBA7606 TaxID=1947559 RepID=UPI0025ED4BC3|nr:glycosyltransferase [Stenotrophomonas sp. UBA7606]